MKHGSMMYTSILLNFKLFFREAENDNTFFIIWPLNIIWSCWKECSHTEIPFFIFVGEHAGRDRIYNMIGRHFFWRGLRDHIMFVIMKCKRCHRKKTAGKSTDYALYLQDLYNVRLFIASVSFIHSFSIQSSSFFE